MKRCIENVLNGTIGVLETFRDRSKEFVAKGEENTGPFAKVVHEIFKDKPEESSEVIKSWVSRGLHALNIATLDDFESFKRESERRSPPAGSSDNRSSG
ncbi:MAG: hypothetical protein ACYC9S_07245 [Leptospirales bacterium]